MGPGLLHPGNGGNPRRFFGHDRGASMGPGLLHPGNRPARAQAARVHRASMGPGLLHPGNTGSPTSWYLDGSLQWGRGCYTPETRGQARALPAQLDQASMGPGLLHPGNRPRSGPDRLLLSCFNGAGVVTPRKPIRPTRRTCWRRCFNGAGVVTPRKQLLKYSRDLQGESSSLRPAYANALSAVGSRARRSDKGRGLQAHCVREG